MEALLAFAAALLALRLGGLLAARWRARRAPELAAWAAALVAYAVASAALAWGAAAGWDAPSFRVYYLFGGLLTAPLLGLGSLLLVRRRWALRPALVYVGLAIGVAIAAPIPAAGARASQQPRTTSISSRRGLSRSSATSRARWPSSVWQLPRSGADPRKRARPRRGRRCRRRNRSIRLGSGENGCFCGNCSTSSLRRIYSFFAHKALTNRYGRGLTGTENNPGACPGSLLG